jgi:hypothetical protein
MHEMTLDEMLKHLIQLYQQSKMTTIIFGGVGKEQTLALQQAIRLLNRIKWLPITEEQRSPTVDDDLLLTNGQRFGVGNNHSGTWEIRPHAEEFEDIYQFTPTHYMPLDALPPLPMEKKTMTTNQPSFEAIQATNKVQVSGTLGTYKQTLTRRTDWRPDQLAILYACYMAGEVTILEAGDGG